MTRLGRGGFKSCALKGQFTQRISRFSGVFAETGNLMAIPSFGSYK
jgi:hypothetical protein